MGSERDERMLAARARVVPEDEVPCIWMQAGLLSCWICDRDLHCESCPLDAALRHDPMRAIAPPRRLPPAGDASAPATEPGAPSDGQGMDTTLGLVAGSRQAAAGWERAAAPGQATAESPLTAESRILDELAGSALPPLDPAARYARTHTWVRDEGSTQVRIGIDPFAARVVGRLRCVVLAPVGTRIREGQPCAWLDQHGGTLTVLSPVTGVVRECNATLGRRAEFELHDPQHADWLLCLIPLRFRTEWATLHAPGNFAAVVQADLREWRRRLDRELGDAAGGVGPTAADGGIRVRDLGELLGADKVHELAATFLGCVRAVPRHRTAKRR